MKNHILHIAIILLLLSLQSCVDEKPTSVADYDGPMRETANFELLYSDSAKVVMKVVAAKQMEFESGDQEFPEGLYIERYDMDGNLTSTIKADQGFYNKKEDQWKGVGDVVVKNILKGDQLNTEELNFKPKMDEIFTDKFVIIKTDDDIIKSQGMKSNLDFSDYELFKIVGTTSSIGN